MEKDPNRFWWLSLVLVGICTGGLYYFERTVYPASSGLVGLVVGLGLGGALAALLEDYFDQNPG